VRSLGRLRSVLRLLGGLVVVVVVVVVVVMVVVVMVVMPVTPASPAPTPTPALNTTICLDTIHLFHRSLGVRW